MKIKVRIIVEYDNMKIIKSLQEGEMKHLKSSSSDLRNIFQKISSGYIAEPLTSFDVEAKVDKVRSFMSEKDYDVVGVRRNGIVAGYVNRSDLVKDTIAEHIIDFEIVDLVDESTPLIELFKKMRESPRPQVFVRVLGEVGGIVTRGDLQKAPVRMWLFGVISLIEMQLLRIIREAYPDRAWDKFINPERLSKARDILKQRKQKNAEIDLADCLQFCDKRDIVISSGLWAMIGLNPEEFGVDLLKDLGCMRDNLAHAQDIVTGFWPGLVNLALKAEKLLIQFEKWCLPEQICA